MGDAVTEASITLAKPTGGQHFSLQVQPSSVYVLSFEPDDSTVETIDNNLSFTFDDGSSITLYNFVSVIQNGAKVYLQTTDGSLIEGQTLIDALAPVEDFDTGFTAEVPAVPHEEMDQDQVNTGFLLAFTHTDQGILPSSFDDINHFTSNRLGTVLSTCSANSCSVTGNTTFLQPAGPLATNLTLEDVLQQDEPLLHVSSRGGQSTDEFFAPAVFSADITTVQAEEDALLTLLRTY